MADKNKQDKQQIKDEKIGSIVYETHVYTSPRGVGSIAFEYRKSGQDMEMKKTHTGVEDIASHDFQVVADEVRDELQQTGVTPVLMDVVKYIESTPGSGIFDQRIIVQETHDQPVYSLVQTTYKHPYKAKHFGL